MNSAQAAWVARPARRAIGAGLVLVLLALAGLLYSSWHRHNPAARQACIFSPVEGSPSLEAGLHIEIKPAPGVIWLHFAEVRVTPHKPHLEHHSERAPPA